MTDPGWQRQWEIFHEATELPADERAAFVSSACGGDAALEKAILDLLAAHDDSSPLLSESALSVAGLADELDVGALIGESIDGYEILSVVGEGGMGVVYAARQREPVERSVAIKIIKLGMNTREVVSRFRQEQQALAVMNHPNIAKVFDAGATADGRPYFVMELVDGVPITNYCDEHRLGTQTRLELCMEVLNGIHHAHQKGVIHRDIKPSNVLVEHGETGTPSIKIIDFGIAKATDQHSTEKTMFTAVGRIIGTPAYMSPEQATLSEQGVDIRTDVYSAAVLLYELLTGGVPFETDSLLSAGYAEMQRIIREDDPPPPSRKLQRLDERTLTDWASARHSSPRTLTREIRGDLDWIVLKGLEKDPARRYSSAAEFAADIGRYLDNLPILARPPGGAYRLQKFVRRHAWGVAVSALALIAILSFSVFSFWQARELAAALDDARVEQARADRVARFIIETLGESAPNRAQGEDVSVREALDRGAERLGSELANEPATRAAILVQMAEIYRQLGDYENAGELLRRAESDLDSLEVPDQAATAELQQVTASLFHDEGNYESASEAYRKAIASLRALDPASADVVQSMKDYGNLLVDAGDYPGAITELVAAVDLGRTVLDEPSALLGSAIALLANAYYQAGNNDLARPLFEESVGILRELETEYPMELAMALSGFGNFLREAGELDEAIDHQEEVVALYRRFFGAAHPFLATALTNLSSAYTRAGRLDEAIAAGSESVDMHEKLFEGPHPNKATARYELAAALSESGRFAEAEESFRAVLDVDIATLGEDHPFVLADLEQIAVVLKNQGKFDEAYDFQQRALDGRIRVLGPDHPDTAAGWLNLSGILSSLGRLDESVAAAERAVEILEGSDETDLRFMAARTQLGSALFRAGRYAESEAIYAEILAVQRRTLEPDHPNLATTLHGIGVARLALGLPAVDVMEEAYDIRMKALGPDHPFTALSLDVLSKARAALE